MWINTNDLQNKKGAKCGMLSIFATIVVKCSAVAVPLFLVEDARGRRDAVLADTTE
jgi:hypothetical protein